MTTTDTTAATGTVTPGAELAPDALVTLAKLREVQSRIKPLAEVEEQLKAQLREALGLGEFTVGGQKALTISGGRKFDARRAAQVLTPDEIAACSVTALDRALVQKTVSPARYAECQAPNGKPTVRVA